MTDEKNGAARQTAIGAFVLGGVALSLAAFILFGASHLFSSTVRATIVFQDSISGLAVGAPVNFRGVRVGAVKGIGIEFDAKTQAAFIPVTIELDPGRVTVTSGNADHKITLNEVIGRGLRAELNTQSFVTGQSEIDLDFDPAAPAVLHPDITSLPEIPTRQSTLQKVTEQLSQLPLRELVGNAGATLQSLRGLSEKLDSFLPPLIESLKVTSDRSAVAIAAASQSLSDMQARADATLGHISRLANAGTLLVNQRGPELRTLLLSADQAVVQARDLITNLKGAASERGADRTNIDSALRDLATTAASLRGLAEDVEHNPQLLLTGRR
jgi:paraquat-inducible protein B